MAEVLIALGGNVGDVRETFDRALARCCATAAEVRLIARSSDYATPPWGVEDQPPFVNCCAAVETSLTPHALLVRAQEVERAFGRDRANERRWGPRTLDIDIIAYDDVALNDADLTLPHPRLFERAFVLVPLADIASDRMIAGVRVQGCTGQDRRDRDRTAAAAIAVIVACLAQSGHDPRRRRSAACRRISAGDLRAVAQARRRRAQGRAVRKACRAEPPTASPSSRSIRARLMRRRWPAAPAARAGR